MKKRFSNNKGFSLVELIIVVAIMAVLIGILAPQYLKYVEKSRVQTDNEYLDSLRKACESVVADPSVNISGTTSITVSVTDAGVTFGNATLGTEVQKIVDAPATGADLFKSKAYESQGQVDIIVSFDDDGDGTADDPSVKYDSTNGLIQ